MKVSISGKEAKKIEPLLKQEGFEIVNSSPDLVVSYGGDGTLLSSEREYPGIPKLPIRNSTVCKKCIQHLDKKVLENLKLHKLKLTKYKKLQTVVNGQKFYALNDFVIRNSDPTHTIRFKISDGPLLIGDGIVVATPFGSTGYFKSITGKSFNKGFAVAFNNTTEKVEPLFLKDNASMTFQLIRGKATLSFDNNPDIFTINEGSELIFKLSNQIAKIYEDTSLRCSNCKIVRG